MKLKPFLLLLLCTILVTATKGDDRGYSEFNLANQDVQVKLDSPLAEYYCRQYLQGTKTNQFNDKRIDNLILKYKRLPITGKIFQMLTAETSPDFATAYFVHRQYLNNKNRNAQNLFHKYFRECKEQEYDILYLKLQRLENYHFVFIPGFAYKSDTSTGADFRNQRKILTKAGISNELAETKETGNVEENSQIIADLLQNLIKYKPDTKVILVSTSKGGAEAAYTLGKNLKGYQTGFIKAWISIGGMLRGTPLAEEALVQRRKYPFLLLTGYPAAFLRNMCKKYRTRIYDSLQIPHHILKIQYIGAPFSGHIKGNVLKRYKILKRYGPNDGLTLLADECIKGSYVLTEIGLDHYYRHKNIDIKTISLVIMVHDLLH